MKSNNFKLFSAIDKIENEMFKKFKTYEEISSQNGLFYRYCESFFQTHFVGVIGQITQK